MKEWAKVKEMGISKHGKKPKERSIEELLRMGVANIDKPQGPTSHQVSAWVREILGIEKAGHGGTLDPRVTGVLPIALNDATKALDALLVGDKEYVAVMHLHQDVPSSRIEEVMGGFLGRIYQTPPVRAAVKRELRTRTIHEIKILEIEGRNVLFKVRCEAGTYIRTLCNDIGEALGVGAHMLDLRRTRTASFKEEEAHTLNDLKDAHVFWREEEEETLLRRIIQPMEKLLEHLPRIVVKDTAVDALCHGANLAIPGILELSEGIKEGDRIAVLTRKGEGVAIARALMTSAEIMNERKGVAADTERVLMEPGTYPRLWK